MLTARRTLAWHGGMVAKGRPVPSGVPEGIVAEWRAAGHLDEADDDGIAVPARKRGAKDAGRE